MGGKNREKEWKRKRIERKKRMEKKKSVECGLYSNINTNISDFDTKLIGEVICI